MSWPNSLASSPKLSRTERNLFITESLRLTRQSFSLKAISRTNDGDQRFRFRRGSDIFEALQCSPKQSGVPAGVEQKVNCLLGYWCRPVLWGSNSKFRTLSSTLWTPNGDVANWQSKMQTIAISGNQESGKNRWKNDHRLKEAFRNSATFWTWMAHSVQSLKDIQVRAKLWTPKCARCSREPRKCFTRTSYYSPPLNKLYGPFIGSLSRGLLKRLLFHQLIHDTILSPFSRARLLGRSLSISSADSVAPQTYSYASFFN